eukprot:4086483-Alexandrium_andersonii.AAC.1
MCACTAHACPRWLQHFDSCRCGNRACLPQRRNKRKQGHAAPVDLMDSIAEEILQENAGALDPL